MARRGAGGNGEKCRPSGLSAEGGNDSEFRQTTSGAHGCAGRADRLPRGKPHACDGIRQLCRMRTPAGGMTRRLRRGSGLTVPWGAHTFLSVAKEKCAKESQRHGDYGKKASTAHFDVGARYVARTLIGEIILAIVRAPNSPFSAVKMGGPFFLRCLSPLCSTAVGGEHTQPLQGGVLWRSLYFFARQKASGKSNPRWPFQRAMRPVAEWRSLLCSWRESAPDPRAARPSAERR